MLKVEHLYVSFTKEFYTLNDINLELGDGSRLTIIGNKESGRTAMLRTLVGLEPIAKGEIRYKDISLEKVDFEKDISLGYLPAIGAFLDNKTVKQNLEYVIDIRTNDDSFKNIKVNNALIEYGLDYIKNKKVKELNYLDKLKLSIARLSLRNIEIFLIDDVFDRLSSIEKDKIIKNIKSLIKTNNASTIVMTDSEDVAKKFGYPVKYLVYGTLQDQSDIEDPDNKK